MADGDDKDKKGSRRSGDGAAVKNRLALANNKEPTFFIGGGNGVALVNDTLEAMGWKRIMDKNDDRYKLKWVELKSTINYGSFKEGEQLVNHIPNCNLLTNKLGLLNTLQEYDKLQTAIRKAKGPRMKLDFIPETYRLDDPRGREAFFEINQPGDIWICKPTGRNQGKGIFLVRDAEEVRKLTEVEEADRGRIAKPLNRIIQRYITNPLLLDNKKFDIRCYMLVASTVPHLVLYHSGYIRLSLQDYDNSCENLIAHLTNQYIQKKDPTYNDVKEETTWNMDRFNDYLNEKVLPDLGLEPDWAKTVLEDRIQQIMKYTFNAVKPRLSAKIGYFDLYGVDFMIDTNMKVYLIEVNVNPCLATNCEALKEVVPTVIQETLHVVIECFEKAKKGKPLMPLQAPNNFKVIYNGSTKGATGTSGAKLRRTSSTSPVRTVAKDTAAKGDSSTSRSRLPKRPVSDSPPRRARSLSPVKEAKESNDNEAVPKDKSDKESKASTKGLTPKATSVCHIKANSSNIKTSTSSKTTSAAKTNDMAVSPYARKVRTHSQAENIRLKMSHSGATIKRTKSTVKPSPPEVADSDVKNRGS